MTPDAARTGWRGPAEGYDLRRFAGAAGCLGSVRALYSELSVMPLSADSPHHIESLARHKAADFDLVDLSVVSRPADAIQDMNRLMRRAAHDGSEGA